MDPNSRPKWDAHDPHSKLGQLFVTNMRKIYNPIGFHKGYNFPLFLIGVGGLMGFVLSRMYYFDINGVFYRDAIPGEFYYYRGGHYRIGVILHLAGVLPGGFLACLQFIPIIRYKALLFHRINGYAAIILFLVGNAGAFMIIQHAVGGSPMMQTWIGLLGAMTTIGLALAYINIKRLQIDQHRAWMLRTWTWAGSIASLRLIQLAGIHCTYAYGHVYYASIRCAEIWYMYEHVGVPAAGNPTPLLYPACNNAIDPTTGVPGRTTVDPATNTGTFVTVSSNGQGPENVAALIRNLFPMSALLAVIIHVIVIEVYLWLTPAEHYRLRQVSYQKQVEAGLRPAGRFRDAGLTGTRIGDAPEWWSLPGKDYQALRDHDATMERKQDAFEPASLQGSKNTHADTRHDIRSGSETEVESGIDAPGSNLAKPQAGRD